MNYYEMLIRRSRNAEPAVPDDEVWYYAPEQVTLYSDTGVVSHTFEDGNGVIKYSAPLTEMPITLRETAITNVKMPDGITSIGYYAFLGCNSLALTSLPKGITSIGNSAFSGCNSLALTSLPKGITSISYGAFSGCNSLALTSLPKGITSISEQAFYYCSNLALTSLPSGLTSIGHAAFMECTSLESITFTGVPTSIFTDAFQDCTNLTDIYVPWYEGDVANAPWGATNATVHYKDASISIDNTLYSMYVGIGGTASFTYSCTEPVTFAVEQGYTLPSGITLSGDTFTWDGTTPKGSYSIVIRGTSQHNPTGSTATMTFNVAAISYVHVRFGAGVDTTLYITNNNGVFTATPSGSWGGTGYHDGIRGTWVSFYPKHGVKYSLDGGTNWESWCFEDTNATLDLSDHFFGNIVSVTKVSGRDSVTLSGNKITVNDPSNSSAIYVFDVEMMTVDDSSSSDESESSGGALTVTGSSTAEINGTYTDTGDTFASQPVYAKAGTPYVIYYSSGMVGTWVIYDNTDNMLEGVVVNVKHTLENGAGPQGTYTGGVTVGD